jgi:hypothetical protein
VKEAASDYAEALPDWVRNSPERFIPRFESSGGLRPAGGVHPLSPAALRVGMVFAEKLFRFHCSPVQQCMIGASGMCAMPRLAMNFNPTAML